MPSSEEGVRYLPQTGVLDGANHHVGSGIAVNAKSLSTIQPTYVFSYVLLERLKRLTLHYIHVV